MSEAFVKTYSGGKPNYCTEPEREWVGLTDDALIEEVRKRGFTIRDAQISLKREWVGLTEEEFFELLHFDGRFDKIETPLLANFIRAIQSKLKEKNT